MAGEREEGKKMTEYRGRTDKGTLEGRERGGPGYTSLMQYTYYMYNIYVNIDHKIVPHSNSAYWLVT